MTEEAESFKVTLNQPCKCGSTSFIMENFESKEPPKLGYGPLIDREFTCASCGSKFVFKGTYLTSYSMDALESNDIMTSEDLDLGIS
jgi:hypothetical protein